MSINIPDVAITDFIQDLHHEFRSMGFLTKETVRSKTGVIGRTVQFPVMNQGIAQQKAIQDTVVPMNVDYDPITLTLQDWYAAEYTDIFSQKDVNWDDKMELVKACTASIGRRCDQLVIDALESGGATNTVGDYSTAFTWSLFRQAFKTLRANGAVGQEMYCLISAGAEDQLLAVSQITSSDYVNSKAIAGNGLNGETIMGVKFIVIPDMTEGGLPLASTDNRDCYMFNKQAVGYASGIDLDVHVDWVAQNTAWLTNCLLKANAAVIDARGVVEIRIDDDLAVA